jgi:SNF2 family DNA or RNA helicase
MSEVKLWDHQAEAIARAKKLDYFGLFFEPGCGKSRTTIEILRDHYRTTTRIQPTFIICPKVVKGNWKSEILKYSKIKEENIIILETNEKKRIKQITEADPHNIFIMNYEALIKDETLEALQNAAAGKNAVLIVDESQRCKTYNSQRTKSVIKLSHFCKRRFILSGTPILNSLEDIWSQFYILDHGKTFGIKKFFFMRDYFYAHTRRMGMRSFVEHIPMKDAEERVKANIQECTMFVEKSTCLSLPPLVKKTIEVEMSKEQAEHYKAMKDDLVTTLSTSAGDKYSIAEIALTKALRLQQIVSGFIRVNADEDFEDGASFKIKENPRLDALKEILSDLAPAHKVIVWAVFKQNYADIIEVCKSLDLEFAEIHGSVKNTQAEIDRFRNSPTCRVMIAHPGAGGTGINLIEASYMIYYSRGFNYEFDVQSEARNHRGGSEMHEKITRIDLVSPGTIDELVLKSLASKQQLSDKILKESIHEI